MPPSAHHCSDGQHLRLGAAKQIHAPLAPTRRRGFQGYPTGTRFQTLACRVRSTCSFLKASLVVNWIWLEAEGSCLSWPLWENLWCTAWEVYSKSWWMGLYNHITAKRHIVWSNSWIISLLDLGRLCRSRCKTLGLGQAKSARTYLKNGKKKYVGTPLLRRTGLGS